MGKVKRNAPCPCSGGKKYKNVCGSKEGAIPADIAAKEAKQIQESLMEYAFTAHRDGISSFINQHAFITELDRQTKDIGVFNLGIWGIFFRPLAGGKTILKNIFRKSRRHQPPENTGNR